MQVKFDCPWYIFATLHRNSELSTTAGLTYFTEGDSFLLAALIPIKIYSNAESDKALILKENQNKSGIYKWTNLINDKQYIGSAVDLSNRLSDYYSTTYMEDALKRSNSHIYRALLKNGYENFSLTIIEYCEPEQCIERENYYLCSLPHEYNILPKAGSRLGHKHYDKTKKKISEAKKGKTLNEETKTKISDAMVGNTNAKNQLNSQQIQVLDEKTNQTTTYNSIREAARALNINNATIVQYFSNNQKKPYKNRYNFKKL